LTGLIGGQEEGQRETGEHCSDTGSNGVTAKAMNYCKKMLLSDEVGRK